MIFLIGFFFICVAILLDEGSTLIAFARGLGALESNVLYLNYGMFAWLSFAVIFYGFMLISWYYMIKYYDKLYVSKGKGHKLYDIFIFMFCFIIIFFTATKVEAALGNINLIVDTFNDEKYDALKHNVAEAEDYRESHPEEFRDLMQDQYYEFISRIGYLQMVFYVISSYLLFRVGYKVSPYQFS